MNIGIIGFGVVGKAHYEVFKDKSKGILIHDPLYKTHTLYRDIGSLMHCDVLFVCVPTPYSEDLQYIDDGIVKSVVEKIHKAKQDTNLSPVVCIKSAIPPLVVRELTSAYPDLRLTVSPEYLSEAKPTMDLIHQEALIVGGDPEDAFLVTKAFKYHSICNPKAAVAMDLTAEEAALIKYMENTFLALKVMFMNEFKFIADKLFGGNFEYDFSYLIKVHQLDSRMGGPYPSQIPGPDGHPGFGGKCLPKDLLTMLGEAERLGLTMPVLNTAWRENLLIRQDRNWKQIKGAVEGASE
jgi:nucleotide sugar dehydrogenase